MASLEDLASTPTPIGENLLRSAGKSLKALLRPVFAGTAPERLK